MLEGEGAIHGPGTKSSRGVVVEITDETGKPVNGAAVSFRLPEEGPGGTFVRGMRTEIAITTPDGRAGIHEILTTRTPGPFQIRVTAVRDSIRAGTVVDQYISEGPVKGGKGASSLKPGDGGTSSRKWVMWVAIAGGAAAAGLAAGTMRGKGSTPGSTAPAAGPAPTLGTPTITIGRPQ